jgi:uncharacterized protein (UPF0332 family)
MSTAVVFNFVREKTKVGRLMTDKEIVSILVRKSLRKHEAALENFAKTRLDCCVSDLYYACHQMLLALLSIDGFNVIEQSHVNAYLTKKIANRVIVSEMLETYENVCIHKELADSGVSEVPYDIVAGLLLPVWNFRKEIERAIYAAE